MLGAATYHRIGLDALWVGLALLVVSTVSTWLVRRVSSPVSNSD
ncbi:putative membrane protein [Mycobacteroides abscessus MAB_091912_2446]|uniref:Putative membrane protein n=1 Tax=Mycobacteroides abscessus MAB_091912_2446 TaxID=1335414 RepID=A0A829MK59_9MYCO|nr:putative membrane protein [Mycobacteroides abscessus MAB_091912_2446]